MTDTQQQTAVVMSRFERLQRLRLYQETHKTVEVNIVQPVAHQVELLTWTAFSSSITESELVTQQWEEDFTGKDIDSNLATEFHLLFVCLTISIILQGTNH